MERKLVGSSNIRAIGWENGTLEVEFSNGKVYSYPDVPEDEYKALTSASSIGSHFHHRIKSRYSGTRS